MKGSNFFHKVVAGLALKPQSVNGAAVNGETILEPWAIGRQLSFLLLGGAFAATVDGTMVIQGQKRSDDSWEGLKEKDGVTALAFTPTLLDDGGDLENGSALGTIPLDTIDTATYKAVRLVFTEGGSAAALIAAGYVISDLHEEVSGQEDDLFAKTQNALVW